MKAISCNIVLLSTLVYAVYCTTAQAEPDPGTIITSSLTTFLAGAMPDTPLGLEAEWNVDGSASGEPAHGLLKMNIPESALADFNNTPDAIALLELHVTGRGDWIELYQSRTNWASNYQQLTWDNFSNGSGLQPGKNMSRYRSAMALPRQGVITINVTDDIRQWASGLKENEGWGFLPTGTDGSDFAGGDHPNKSIHPRLILAGIDQPAMHDVLIPKNSTWYYCDNLSTHSRNYPVDSDGNSWNSPDFNVNESRCRKWESGQGVFGNGVAGIINTPLDKEQRPGVNRPTFLFRRDFEVTADQIADNDWLELTLLSDDGTALYINGTLVFEKYLPGTITEPDWDVRSYATRSAYDQTEDYMNYRVNLADFPDLLNEGINTIAVETHNRDEDSTDIGFDLELSLVTPEVLGNLTPIPEPCTALMLFLGLLGLIPVIRKK